MKTNFNNTSRKSIIKTVLLITFIVIGITLIFSETNFITRAGTNFAAQVLTHTTDIKYRIKNFFGEKYKTQIKILKTENDRLRAEQLSFVEYDKKINRLKELLNLKSKYENDFFTVSAKVISYNLKDIPTCLIINKGLDYGVSDGDAVVCDEGIVGVVKKAENNYSVVSTVFDSDFAVSVRATRNSQAALLCGDEKLARQNLCKLVFLSDYSSINAGDFLESFGGVFPEGLSVGKVYNRISDDNGDYFTVKPAVDIYKTYEVLVIGANFKEQNIKVD